MFDVQEKLEGLLSEAFDSVREREKTAFDISALPFQNQIVLFGAGTLGRKILTVLRKEGVEPCAFSDNNPSLWGIAIDGIPVLSPEEASQAYSGSAVFVVTIWHHLHHFQATQSQLEGLGCRHVLPVLPLLWKYEKYLLPHYCLDLPHKIIESKDKVRETFALWGDDKSKEIYLSFLQYWLHADARHLPLPVDHFPNDLIEISDTEVFVDCGAYNGDTVDDFLKRCKYKFKKIIAFEPDPTNFSALESSVKHLSPEISSRIKTLNLAVSESTGQLRFSSIETMGSAISGSGNCVVECDTLDNVFSTPEMVHSQPTFIKIDVEGADLDTLRGSSNLLSRSDARWAVTCEHRQSDLWDIPAYLRASSPHYKLFLRTHFYDGHDLVCYAIPSGN